MFIIKSNSVNIYYSSSWDQMAKYDIPALLNFALEISGQSTLDYVGHSQGTLVAFTGFTLDLNLAKKVKHLFAMGPVYTVKDIDITLKDIVTSELVKLLAVSEHPSQEACLHQLEIAKWPAISDLGNNPEVTNPVLIS